MKTLYLARHAKSSWRLGSLSDFDRPLDKRGETDAEKMGKALAKLNDLPERIIASPAMRVKQTCKTYCVMLDYPEADVEWNRDIYEAHTVTLLQILTSLDEDTKSVMLIGHNPAIENLLVHLCGYSAVNEHKQADGKIFTTANIVQLQTESAWKDLVMGDLTIGKFLRPKEI